MSVRITYFVHGTTTDNERDLATGWQPGELSEKGIEQSKALLAQVPDASFDVVFTSDLKRAVDSADLAFGNRYPRVADARLREANYGDLTGASVSDFKQNLEDYIEKEFPHGESYRDVEKRMRTFLDDVRRDYDGKHVAIVAHQAPQLALDVIVQGKSWHEAIQEDWRPTKAWKPGWQYDLV